MYINYSYITLLMKSSVHKNWNIVHGIIEICGGSIFLVFYCSPPQWIKILNENKFWKS